MPSSGCKRPEAELIYAAGLVEQSMRWQNSVTVFTLISKMNWRMCRAIGYNPKSRRTLIGTGHSTHQICVSGEELAVKQGKIQPNIPTLQSPADNLPWGFGGQQTLSGFLSLITVIAQFTYFK